jgi:arylsulfatase A-like enzyme
MLVADDLGVDIMASYDVHPEPAHTPVIDQLALDGVLFRNAYSYPSCSAARAATLTGRFGRRTGIGDILTFTGDTFELPLAEVTVAEALRASALGYSVSAVGKWHLSGARTASFYDHPLLQGFDGWIGTASNLENALLIQEGRTGYYHWEKSLNGNASVGLVDGYVTSDTVDDAIAKISTMPEPWFLWVAFNAPHDPFTAPPPGLLREPVAEDASRPDLYRSMVEAMDTEIGRLLDSVGDELRDRTTVVFVGDNGTPADAVLSPFDETRAKPSLYEGGTHVPLLVTGPAVAVPGAESEAMVHVVDLFATTLDLAGVDPSTVIDDAGHAVRIDGQSLLPYLADPSRPGRRTTLFTERFAPIGPPPYAKRDRVALRGDRYKIIRTESWNGFYMLDPVTLAERENLLDQAGLSDEEQRTFDFLNQELDGQLALFNRDQ